MLLPDSIACIARYCRIDSGIESMSSPLSRLFLAIILILARLGGGVSIQARGEGEGERVKGESMATYRF